jgi:hypothetical protein
MSSHVASHVRKCHTRNPSRANPRRLCSSCSLPPTCRNVIEVFEIVRLDGTAIGPSADPLFASHKEKIEAMQEWQDSPFSIMRIVTDMSAGAGSFLKRIAQKVNCSACKIGQANKTCVQEFCKKCCLVNIEIKTCRVHGKKEVTVQEEV